MRKAVVFLILFSVFSFVFGNEAEITEKRIDIHVLEDGRVVKQVYEKIKVKGFTGLRRAGEWFYSYNPSLEKVEILKSITHTPDGKVVESPDNAILDFSPYSVQNAPDFSHMREKIVSHTGLEPGSVIEFEYRITDKVPHRAVFAEILSDRFFVKKVTVNIVSQGFETIVNKVDLEGSSFVAENIKPLSINSKGEYFYKNVPFVAVIIKNPSKLIANLIENGENADLEGVLKECSLDNLSGKRLFYAFCDFVDTRLKTVYLKEKHYSFKCRPVAEIVKSGYATPLEKAVLVYKILKLSGLNPVFLTSACFEKSVPLFIEGYGVKCGETVWPFEEFDLPFYALSGKRVKSPVLKASLSVFVEQNKEGYTGKYFYEGNTGVSFSLSPFKSQKEETVEKNGDFVIKEGSVKGKAELKLALSDWLSSPYGFRLYDITGYSFLECPYPIGFSETITLKFDKKPKVIFHSKTVKNRIGFSSVKFSLNGNVLKIERKLKIKPCFLNKNEFYLYRELITPLASDSYRTVVLEK